MTVMETILTTFFTLLQVNGKESSYVEKTLQYECLAMTQYCFRTNYTMSIWLFLLEDLPSANRSVASLISNMADTQVRADGFKIIWNSQASRYQLLVHSVLHRRNTVVNFMMPGDYINSCFFK